MIHSGASKQSQSGESYDSASSGSYDDEDDAYDLEKGPGKQARGRFRGKDRGSLSNEHRYVNNDDDADSIKDTNEAIGVLGVSFARLRRIDQSWAEKVWMCVDAVQLFALLWSLSQPWPWPRPWLRGTRFVVFANLDVVSVLDAAMTITGPGTTSSPWGERPGYAYYGAVFALIPVVIIAVWVSRAFLATIWLNRSMFFNKYVLGRGKAPAPTSAVLTVLATFESVVLRLAHVLYLPVVMAVLRLFICDADGTLSVDPGMSCTHLGLVPLALFGLGMVGLSTLHLTRNALKSAHAITTYGYGPDHERFLQKVEMEYVLMLCESWDADHLWLVSSFRRHAVHYRILMVYQKLALVFIYASIRSAQAGQVLLFWGVVSVWSAWTCAHPPYRCQSSNRLYLVLQATLWTDTFLGMLTGYGVRSGMLVAAAQYSWLIQVNCIGVVSGLFVVFVLPKYEARKRRKRRRLARQQARRWRRRPVVMPTMNPQTMQISGPYAGGRGGREGPRLGAVVQSATAEIDTNDFVNPNQWPTRATLASLARLPKRVEWIEVARRAREFRFVCETCPAGMEPIRSLEMFMRKVRVQWAEAKAEDSALEPILGAALEQLARVQSKLLKTCGGRGGGLTPGLEKALQDEKVVAGIARRRRAQMLMTDRQKRVMLKLLAVSAFLNKNDYRESSTANLHRLQDDTKRALGMPAAGESYGLLRTLCTQWKRLIKKSEREFEEINGRAPTNDEKEVNSDWYEAYKALHAVLESLPSHSVNNVINNDGKITGDVQSYGVGVSADYPDSLALTPAVSESTATLIHATEQLLLAAEKDVGERDIEGEMVDEEPLWLQQSRSVDVEEVETCRKEWKRVIREWEADFEDQIGSKPDVSDKQLVRSYYEYYRRLKDILNNY